MRPLSLHLEGFRSHERPTEISFEDRTLIAIVGPTGSGKSSILDGIAYALYGKTPRVQSASGRLVCTRSDRARIRFRFSVDGRVYEVGRSIPAQAADYLLDEAGDEKVTGARAIGSKVQELLGLDFDAFESSVLLAQNKFSRFLDAETTERTKILKGIFRIEQIDELRKAAVARIGDIKLGLAEISGARGSIPPDAADLHKEAKKHHAALKKTEGALSDALPEELAFEQRLRELAGEAAASKERIDKIGTLIGRLPQRGVLQAIADEEAGLATKLRDATNVLQRCEKDLSDAGEALTKLEDKLGAEADLIRAEGKAEAAADLLMQEKKLVTDETEATALIERYRSELAKSQAEEEAAQAGLAAARAERVAGEDAHRAHALRLHLAAGDPCPVCEQTVTKVPSGAKPAALTSAIEKESAQEKVLEAARAKSGAAEQRLEVEVARAGSRTQELAVARKKLKSLQSELSGLVGKVADPMTEIKTRLDKLSQAKKLVEAARAAREQAGGEQESLKSAGTEIAGKLRGHAATLVEISSQVDLDVPDIEARAADLLKHAENLQRELQERREGLAEDARKNAQTVEETQGAAARLRKKLGIVDGSIADAVVKARADIGVAEHVIGDLAAKIEQMKELEVRESQLRANKQVFDQLADDLRNETFINFLLEDRRRTLSDLASERLRAMTGRYRFDDEGTFDIIDELDGDKRRDVDTLSGGESFLASLALALGLAESAARHGGRLQSFFLDEGFGTLDPESFDLALDGIERIVAPDRLIGLVSHVPALAVRVDDKIVLEKDADGMSVLVSGDS